MNRRSPHARVALALALSPALLTFACEPASPDDDAEATVSPATLPSQFAETTLASGLASPTAMEVAPDGRIFVCEQGGKLRVVKNGSLLATPFLQVTVNSSGERGLLGVAFDPNFSSNRFVYVYYTATSPSIHNRVSRFTASSSNPDVAASGSEQVLLELNNLSSATNHNGGAIHFGPDGKLYIAVGENATGSNAQTLSNMLGKMLRINSDGSIPTDNPFYSSASGNNRSIWARGLRNPFTFAFQPGTGKMFINDVGQNSWEEINEGTKGSNYGWPSSEGNNNTSGYKAPFFTYATKVNGTCAIIGGAFYNPPTVNFPSTYVGQYFYGDYCAGWIRRINPSTKSDAGFLSGLGSNNLVDIKVASDGSLYYLGRSGGVLRRVRYTGSSAPTISQQPSNVTVSVGGSATFSVAASGSTPLSYQWQRNGSNISGATSSSYTRSNVQSSDNGSTYRCVVSNSAGSATSNAATLTVTNNAAPTATITTPVAGTLYSGGQTINYAGTGTDPEDGTLSGSAFTWWVDLHHDTHTHPQVAPTSGSTSGSFVIPDRGETSDNVWYRIHLTVTDKGGLTHSVYRDVLPRKVNVTLTANPSGLQLKLDGQPILSPYTFTGVVGIIRQIEAVTPQSSGGKTWQFTSWSDGKAAIHEITTPSSATTYTATFTESAGGLPSPWLSQDVGSVGVAGAASYGSGTFTVAGSGADIWGTADGFRFVYRSLSGDGEITARVTGITRTADWSKGGVMIRESLAANARHGFMLLSGAGTVAFQRRVSTGGSSTSTSGGVVSPPAWVRLRRTGSTIAAFHSSNGSTWTQIGSETIAMASNVLVGLAVTSHANTTLATGTFDNVSVTSGGSGGPVAAPVFSPGGGTYSSAQSVTITTATSGATIRYTTNGSTPTSTTGTVYSGPVSVSATTTLRAIAYASGMTDSSVSSATYTIDSSPPGSLPSPWVSQDVGSVGVAGSASYASGTFTLDGSGSDIWGAADAFRFAYQPLSGDGEITARVTGITRTHDWSKAGVMIRESLAAGSRHGFMLLSGAGTVAFQRRVSTGGSSTSTSAGGLAAPTWVRIRRTGSTVTAFHSSNGSTWTQIGSDTIAMASNAYIGLAVTSHDNSAIATGTFDNVSVTSGSGGGGGSDAKLSVGPAAVSASADDGNVPANTVDGNLSTRWSANGDGQWIQYDLGSNRRVAYLRVAVYNGDGRVATFDVLTSTDGSSWTPARLGAQSAMTLGLQTIDFSDVGSARYVRILGHSNSVNTWNSFTEVEIWGGN